MMYAVEKNSLQLPPAARLRVWDTLGRIHGLGANPIGPNRFSFLLRIFFPRVQGLGL